MTGDDNGQFTLNFNANDPTALEAAFMHGLTRFSDPGRGQGIQQMRKQVRRWAGAISIRSGTARIGQVPEDTEW